MNVLIKKLEKLIKEECKKYKGIPMALSGGIDSSVLAYYVKPTYGFTVVSPGGDAYDELQYADRVAKHLSIRLIIIKPTEEGFKKDIKEAIKIIGKPTPHYNVYPLYVMFKTLKETYDCKELIISDGPDESMSGYARNLIMDYLYKVYDFEAFIPYKEIINRLLPDPTVAYSKLTGSKSRVKGDFSNLVQYMNRVDMEIKRPEMDIMASQFSKHFGIKIYKPYESKEIDDFMFNLPDELKINRTEYGKYALRVIADKYLPKDIAWRKVKRGGPIFPVNEIMGWDKDGKYNKEKWLKFQEDVLND